MPGLRDKNLAGRKSDYSFQVDYMFQFGRHILKVGQRSQKPR